MKTWLPLQSPGGSTNESLTSILNRETSSWWRARPGKPHREAGSREIGVSHLAKLGVRSTHHASRLTWSGTYEWAGLNAGPFAFCGWKRSLVRKPGWPDENHEPPSASDSALPLPRALDSRDAAMNARHNPSGSS